MAYEHRHVHPVTGAKGGWHAADMQHTLASKHDGKIETREVSDKEKTTNVKRAVRRPSTPESVGANTQALGTKYKLERILGEKLQQ